MNVGDVIMNRAGMTGTIVFLDVMTAIVRYDEGSEISIPRRKAQRMADEARSKQH